MASSSSHFYEFGPFSLDASERTLRRGEEFVHLTPKEMEILLALVRGGGRLVTKEELLKEVWPDTFVEEATLAQNIFTLRKALGRQDAGRQYIETVPRRGYRFVQKVSEGGAGGPGGSEGGAAGEADVEKAVRFVEQTLADAGLPARIEAAGGEFRAGGQTQPGGPAGANGDGAHAGASRTAGRDVGDAPPSTSPPATATEGAPAPAPPSTAKSAAVDLPSRGAARPTGERPGHPARAAVIITVAVVLAAAGLVYAVYRLSLRPHLAPRQPAPFESMQFTRLPVPGAVFDAAVSPDGHVLAYIANEAGGQSIWVRQISAASESRRLVEAAPGTLYPGLIFSPDGQHLYYATGRPEQNFAALLKVPVFGGPARKVIEQISSPVSFAPDGKRLAFIRGPVEQGRTLYVADADGGNERQVASSAPPRVLVTPAWSPDGQTIACAFALTDEYQSGRPSLGVTAFDAASGAERQQLPGRWYEINQLAWLPDGAGLLMSAAERELSPPQIWRLSYPEGVARRVTNDLNSYQSLSLTADAATLVTVQTDRVPNIWVGPASDPARARQITSGTGRFDGYYGVAWTPDGRLVYSSVASGSWDIWVMNADGTGARQLTLGARSNYGPAVSPDGRYIVFVSNRAGGPFNIWRMDADGSNPRQLTLGRGENFPHVTPDGRWVVYATYGFGERNLIWKAPIDGGEPVALTSEPSSWPYVSPDGKSFVCVYNPAPGAPVKLAVFPFEGGPPAKLFDVEPTFRMNTVWLPDNRGIAYADARDGVSNLWLQPLSGGKPVRLTDFKDAGVTAYDFSRDGKQLVLTRTSETTGVVLIKDFK